MYSRDLQCSKTNLRHICRPTRIALARTATAPLNAASSCFIAVVFVVLLHVCKRRKLLQCTQETADASFQRCSTEGSFTGHRFNVSAGAAASLSESSISDADVDDDVSGTVKCSSLVNSSRPPRPTTFQQRVASAKLSAAARRWTPAAAINSRPVQPTRSTSQRQDSLATLDPDDLANLLGSNSKLCSLVPPDTHADVDSLTPGKDRAKVKRCGQKTKTSPTSCDNDLERPTTGTKEEHKSRRKPKHEKHDKRSEMLDAAEDVDDDDGKSFHASSKVNARRTQQNEFDRRMAKNDTTEQTPVQRRHRATAERGSALPVFELGEYPTPVTTTLSPPRLDAIRKSVERVHRMKRNSDKQLGVERGGRRGDTDEIGVRTTLQSGALLAPKTQFVKLKVQHALDALINLAVRARAGCTFTDSSV